MHLRGDTWTVAPERSSLPLLGFVSGLGMSVLLWGGLGSALWLWLSAP
jgi:hypothetical protein